MIGEAAGELEYGFGGDVVVEQSGVAAPANLDAREEIGLGARQPVEPRRLELRLLAENLGIRRERQGRAAPVLGRAHIGEAGRGQAAREGLAPHLLAPRDLDDGLARQRVDHGNADAVQPARGRIDLVREFPARMERGHDHLQRRFARIFRMLVDRNAAAVVGDGEPPRRPRLRLQRHLDPRRVPRHRLVHAVVEHLGGEMVQRALVDPRHTCPGGGAPAPALRALRSNGRRNRRRCGRWKRTGRRPWACYRLAGIRGARFLACSIHSLLRRRSGQASTGPGRAGVSAEARRRGWRLWRVGGLSWQGRSGTSAIDGFLPVRFAASMLGKLPL